MPFFVLQTVDLHNFLLFVHSLNTVLACFMELSTLSTELSTQKSNIFIKLCKLMKIQTVIFFKTFCHCIFFVI